MRDFIVGIVVGIAVFSIMYSCAVSAATSAEAGTSSTVQASCYGSESGPLTASGDSFDPQGLTAAHRSLPFGTRLLVRHGGRGVVAVVNDRGPAEWTGKDIDLAQGACESIGLEGVGAVEVEQVESAGSAELPKTGGPR